MIQVCDCGWDVIGMGKNKCTGLVIGMGKNKCTGLAHTTANFPPRDRYFYLEIFLICSLKKLF